MYHQVANPLSFYIVGSIYNQSIHSQVYKIENIIEYTIR